MSQISRGSTSKMEVKKNSSNRVREDCEAEILVTIREHAFKIKAWTIYTNRRIKKKGKMANQQEQRTE